jgi:quercetin dioxygenase-like cupin family protein
MTTITKPAELNFLGATARILSSGGALGLVHMDQPAGDMPPLHVHRNEDEGFYVLGGELTLFLPGESVTLRAGDFFLASRGVPHAYEAGPDGARTLVSSAPSGFERFVLAVAALDEGSPEILGGVAAEYGIEILGPPGARP